MADPHVSTRSGEVVAARPVRVLPAPSEDLYAYRDRASHVQQSGRYLLSRLFALDEDIPEDVQHQVGSWVDAQFGGGVRVDAKRALHLTPTDLSVHGQTLMTAISLLLVLHQYSREVMGFGPLNRRKVIDQVEEALLRRGISNFAILEWTDYEKLFDRPPGYCTIRIQTPANVDLTVRVTKKGEVTVLSNPSAGS